MNRAAHPGAAQPVEYVQLCRFCGFVNPLEETQRCHSCGSFSGLSTVPRPQGEAAARRIRIAIWKHRYIPMALLLAVAVALGVWAFWDSLGLAPDPPLPTTGINAEVTLESWPMERRDVQNSGFSPEGISGPPSVKWTFDTAQALVSGPALAHGRVFLATEDGRALALDAGSGQLVWEYAAGAPSGSVPAIAGDLMFFTLRPGVLVALEHETGALRWQKEFDEPALASPIVADGALFVGSADNVLYALDAATGEELWTFTAGDWVTAPVAYVDGMVVVASQSSRVHVIDAKTGREQLVYNAGRGRGSPGGPVAQGDRVYFGSYGGRVWAIDRRDHSRFWDGAALFWKTNFFVWGLTGSAPVQRGSVWANDLGGEVSYSPAVAHGAVYAANLRGRLSAFDLDRGDELWSTQLEQKITSAPTVAGDTALVGTETGLVAVDAHTGDIRWEFPTGGKITGGPAAAGNTIYVSSHDGSLYALTGPDGLP